MSRSVNEDDRIVRLSGANYQAIGELVFDFRVEQGRKGVLNLLAEYAATPEGKAAIQEFKSRQKN